LKSLRISIERHHASAFCTRVTFRDCRTLRPPSAEADKRRSGRPSPVALRRQTTVSVGFRPVAARQRRSCAPTPSPPFSPIAS
jgi:hypothetical protein